MWGIAVVSVEENRGGNGLLIYFVFQILPGGSVENMFFDFLGCVCDFFGGVAISVCFVGLNAFLVKAALSF